MEQLCNVLSSAIKAELGALFVNCHRGTEMSMSITDMGNSQATTQAVMNSATGD